MIFLLNRFNLEYNYFFTMIKRQQAMVDKNNEMFKDDTLHQQTKVQNGKISNLTPYLTEI